MSGASKEGSSGGREPGQEIAVFCSILDHYSALKLLFFSSSNFEIARAAWLSAMTGFGLFVVGQQILLGGSRLVEGRP